uniref:Protein FAR1-RELATED SEQUENCE n=1 Tax=Lactuca sativa TaxID=4236 RepID=A0A9R1XQ24_LACSA|nr:hypothetical protein LSAT_V11C300113070 [Lactuca sativa]
MYDNSEYHFGDYSSHKKIENELEFNDNEAYYNIDDDNIDFQKEQSHVTHDYVSLGGSSYWIPVVSDQIKPKINSNFDSYRAPLSMYYNYASVAGFDVGLGPIRTIESDIITQRQLLFNREDNHKKCVTFGVGLLSREDGSSYSWLLTTFLKTFKKQPTLVLTDQDPTLIKAINQITSELATNSAFRKRFHSIIWNSKLEPHVFEKEWKSCLHEFNISNNKWMQEMYGLRRRWVPAFFKDIPMSGLMRTTSLSEGQNWSFQNNTLTVHRLITSSPIEPHASKVYTRKIFYQVQKEISDSDKTCFQMSVTSNNGVDTIIILEKQKNITTRQPSSPVVDDKLEEYHYDSLTEDTQYMVTHSKIDGSYKYRCVSFLSHDASKLKSYLEDLNKLKKKFVDDCPAPEIPSRESFYNQIIGIQLTNDAPDIDNPSDIRNKGTGSRGKRLKSKKEMLEKACSKPKRKCVLCKQLVNHDKRNCPLKKRD